MQDIIFLECYNDYKSFQEISVSINKYLYYDEKPLDFHYSHKEKISKIMLKILINKDTRFAISVIPGKIKLQISKTYLEDCFNNYVIPSNNLISILRDLPFSPVGISTLANMQYIEPAMPANANANVITKLELMQHQINNVAWIKETESQQFKYSYCHSYNFSEIKLSDDCVFYIDLDSNMCYSYESLKKCMPINIPITFLGGILCDEVGLGKTLSFVASILADKYKHKYNPKKKITLKHQSLGQGQEKEQCGTLVLCPKRLVQQWASEVYKYVGDLLSVHVITSILSLKSSNIEKMKKADIVISSMQMLANTNYLYDNKVAKFSSIKWKRVIVDESHEFLVIPHPGKEYRTIWCELMAIKSSARWLCSGTPFAQQNKNLFPALDYLTDNLDCAHNLLNLDYNIILDQIARRTTKEQADIIIKQPIYETKIIKFTNYDSIIYADAVRNRDIPAMWRICSNIFSVGEHMELAEVIKDKTEFYLMKIEKGIQENKSMETEMRELVSAKAQAQAQAQTQMQGQAHSQMQMQGQAQAHSHQDDIKKELQTIKAAIRYRKNTYPARIEHNLRENEHYNKQIELLEKMKAPETTCIITGNELLDEYLICPEGHCYSMTGIKIMRSYKTDRHILCPYTQRKLFPAMFTKPIIKKAWGSKIGQLRIDISEIIGNSFDNENRIIIFSKYAETLKAIAAFLEEERYNYVCPSGTASQIAIGINKFKTDINIRLLLLCSEKSSAGTNIVEATHIILFDTLTSNTKESRAIETQAVARAVRIGQKNNVRVLRYIISDSIEEETYITLG